MKICPYCGESIQNGAKKCRFCKSMLTKENNKKIVYSFNIDRKIIKIIGICLISFIFLLGSYYTYKYYSKGSKLDNIYKSIVKILYTESDGNGGGGSGILFSKDGLILTNNHIIEGADYGASIGDIEICILKDISKEPKCGYEAELLIRNPYEDLAILKIKNYKGKNQNQILYYIKNRLSFFILAPYTTKSTQHKSKLILFN